MKFVALFLLSAVPFSAFAEEKTASPSATPAPLSTAGQKRIQQNLEILKQNLADTQSNIETIDTNLKSLEGELGTLVTLDSEHQTLKKKYQQFLAGSAKENEKNEKALRDLEQFLRNAKEVLAKDPENAKVRSQLDDAERDRMERQSWRANTKVKSDKLQGLLGQLNAGADEIRGRKGQIQGQMRSWQSRRTEFETLKIDIERRIRQTESMAKASTPNESKN